MQRTGRGGWRFRTARTRSRSGRLGTAGGSSLIAGGRSLAVMLATTVVIAAAVLVRPAPVTSVQGASATRWLSGEAKGRVVLATARSARPSIGVAIGTGEAGYDLVDLGPVVLVQDRASGVVTVLDGRSGLQLRRFESPSTTTGPAALVAAGEVAFLVDSVSKTARRISADGQPQPEVPIASGFDDWVGTPDGLLYLFDHVDGTWTRFNGTDESTTSFADPGTDFVVTTVGVDPVVVDRTNRRVRWLRRFGSVPLSDLGGQPLRDPVLVQESDPSAACLVVVSSQQLSCIGPDAVLRSVALEASVAGLGEPSTKLFTGRSVAAVTQSDGSLQVIDMATGAVTVAQRSDPSTRDMTGWNASGPLVLDDPGSQFAYTLDNSQIIKMDKFSRRTVVISTDGSTTQDGLSELDDNAAVAGTGSSNIDQQLLPPPDDNGRNDAPVARPDRVTTRAGRDVTVNVLVNDSDPDGDPLAIVSATSASTGQVVVLEGARISFQAPPGGGATSISFSYTIADPGGLESSSTVTIDVLEDRPNTSPVANGDSATAAANQQIDIPVLANDLDAEGDKLTISTVDIPLRGSTGIGSDGTVRYEPAPGFVGTDSFTYTIVDGYGGQASASVRVVVEKTALVNRAPLAIDDRVSAQPGKRVRVQVLDNDTDPDGDVLRVVDVSLLPGAEISIVDGTAIDVIPGESAVGLLTFTYAISDAEGLTATADVAVFVDELQPLLPPTAVDDFATSASVAIPIAVVANDVDPAGGQLVITEITQPVDGSGSAVRISPTTLQFTPTVGFLGTSRFSYTVTNAAGLVARANVAVVVIARSGSGPVARNDAVTIFFGQSAVVAPLANDSHPDGLPFDFVGQLLVRSGSATINSDRTITFTPPSGAPTSGEGDTYSVDYTIQDSNLLRSSATVTISVVPRPIVNRAPIARDDVISSLFQTSILVDVLANDSDPDGDILVVDAVGVPSHGFAEQVGSRIRFTPPNGFFGLATVSYRVADPSGAVANATVSIQIADRTRLPPVASTDLVNLVVGQVQTVLPLGNDVDPDGENAALVLVQIGPVSPTGGPSASIVGQALRITAGTVLGTFQVPYSIVDSDGLPATGTVIVVVQSPPNRAPVAQNDTQTLLAVPTLIDVLANDYDLDGGLIAIESLGPLIPGYAGSVTINPGRTAVVFSPSDSASGTVSFTYTVSDEQGALSTASVTLTVTACPAVPVLAALSATTRFNSGVTIALFGGDSVGSSSSVSISEPVIGTAVLIDSSSVRYTPRAGYNGSVSFSYSVTTACNAVATNVISITVNRPPTARPDSAATGRNQPVLVQVLANDTDPDADTLSVQSVGNATNGTVSLVGDAVQFVPNLGFSGSASFSYVVEDVGGLTDIGLVTVEVSNSAPTANPDSVTIQTLTSSVSVPVTANDVDPNLDQLTVVGLGAISVGSATIIDNAIVYSPALGQGPGQVTIRYTISDGQLTSESTLTIVISNRPPIANADYATLDLSLSDTVTVDVLSNDSDPDGTNDQLELIDVSIVDGDGSATFVGGSVRFTASPNLSPPATVTISYTIRDADGATSSGTLTVTIS